MRWVLLFRFYADDLAVDRIKCGNAIASMCIDRIVYYCIRHFRMLVAYTEAIGFNPGSEVWVDNKRGPTTDFRRPRCHHRQTMNHSVPLTAPFDRHWRLSFPLHWPPLKRHRPTLAAVVPHYYHLLVRMYLVPSSVLMMLWLLLLLMQLLFLSLVDSTPISVHQLVLPTLEHPLKITATLASFLLRKQRKKTHKSPSTDHCAWVSHKLPCSGLSSWNKPTDFSVEPPFWLSSFWLAPPSSPLCACVADEILFVDDNCLFIRSPSEPTKCDGTCGLFDEVKVDLRPLSAFRHNVISCCLKYRRSSVSISTKFKKYRTENFLLMSRIVGVRS